MITTYSAYFDIQDDYQVLLGCIQELGDGILLRKILTLSSDMDGRKIDEYARIVQNIAISQNRMDVVDDLQMAHLVN